MEFYMSFNEKIKIEVKEKAAFRCCRCQSISVQVHHIIPEAAGGSDVIDNAAPLCPSCHDAFGDNPEKRKEIKQMRDWWYKKVEEKFASNDVGSDQLRQINAKLEDMQNKQSSELKDLKKILKEIAVKTIDGITAENADITASSIVNASTAAAANKISAVTLGDRVHANVKCYNCGTFIGLLVGSNKCPNCGTPIV
jgi:rubrerythrin